MIIIIMKETKKLPKQKKKDRNAVRARPFCEKFRAQIRKFRIELSQALSFIQPVKQRTNDCISA